MSSINVCILNAGKKQVVTLPRDMNIAALQQLAPLNASLSVNGCTPSGATTLGDLYDVCSDPADSTLRIQCVVPVVLGCGPGCVASSLAQDKNTVANNVANEVVTNTLGPGATAGDLQTEVGKGMASSVLANAMGNL